jgi:hypothetical protein
MTMNDDLSDDPFRGSSFVQAFDNANKIALSRAKMTIMTILGFGACRTLIEGVLTPEYLARAFALRRLQQAPQA